MHWPSVVLFFPYDHMVDLRTGWLMLGVCQEMTGGVICQFSLPPVFHYLVSWIEYHTMKRDIMTIVQANGQLCFVSVYEAKWLTGVFTLWHKGTERTNTKILKKKQQQINKVILEILTDLAVTALLAQTFLLSQQFRFFFRWFSYLMTRSPATMLRTYTVQYFGQATWHAEKHAVHHNRFCSCANTDEAAERSLHPPQVANAPALWCQWKIPLQIPHIAKSYGGGQQGDESGPDNQLPALHNSMAWLTQS